MNQQTTRTEYRKARRLLRDNGAYALRWLTPWVADSMSRLIDVQNSTDPLAERADIVRYCKREGLDCNVRHTQPMGRAKQ